ncbi:hypothetical protein V1502_04130 [Bacillus sp. SCS-153A]|uniref:hypothetical protein n=1 Tax=Rossellomorea sedimentorum TaxID=3115294 RepID=UPI003906BB7A
MDILSQYLKILPADEQHLREVFSMYIRCKDNLLKQKIFLWDDDYPNEEYFKEAIRCKEMFLLNVNGQVSGRKYGFE